MGDVHVHMNDYPGSDRCLCCIEKREASDIKNVQHEMANELDKMSNCKMLFNCSCCLDTRKIAKSPNLTNAQMNMCMKVFKTHNYEVPKDEIDSSTLLYMFLLQASDADLVDVVKKHFVLLEGFVDYQSTFLLKKLKECSLKNAQGVNNVEYCFFRRLLIHLSISKYSSWKRLKFIFEQIIALGIRNCTPADYIQSVMTHYPRNVKISFICLAAVCEQLPLLSLKKYYGTFCKVLKNSLDYQETASMTKDLFLALAHRAEEFLMEKKLKKYFFTFCKKTFGNSLSVIRERATHYWLPDFARLHHQLMILLCKSIKVNFKNNSFLSKHNVSYYTKNSFLPVERYAFLMCTMGLYCNEFVDEMKHNIVQFINSRKDDLSIAAAEYFAKNYDEKSQIYNVAEMYLIFSKLTMGFNNLGRHCKARFRRTKLLTFIKNAAENWIKPSLFVYNPRREVAFDALSVFYLQDHDARDFVEYFWENSGIDRKIKILKLIEEKCGGLSMGRWEELITGVKYELDHYRLYTEIRTLRPTNPYKFDHDPEFELAPLVETCQGILKGVGSYAFGVTAKVPRIREKFIKDAEAANPNLPILQIERIAAMLMKQYFYTPLFTLMYKIIDRNLSSPSTFRTVIKGIYSLILRVEDKKVIDTGVEILKHCCARASGFTHHVNSLHTVFSAFLLEFKLFVVDPTLEVRIYALFHVTNFFMKQLSHLPLINAVVQFLIHAWSLEKNYIEEVSRTFYRTNISMMRCCKILNFFVRSSNYDLSDNLCAISREICRGVNEHQLTSHISRLAASIFGRIFPQHPILLPLYEFLRSHPAHLPMYEIFMECLKKNPENEVALIFFSRFAFIDEDYYPSNIKTALVDIREACFKLYRSRRYTARATGLQICYNFLGPQDLWSHKYQKSYKPRTIEEKILPLKRLTISTKEEALQLMMDALRSKEHEKIRNAAFFGVDGKLTEKEQRKEFIIARICNLVLFGNHEHPEIRFLASCGSDCNLAGTRPINATSYLLLLLVELQENGTAAEIFEAVRNLLQPRTKELTELNPAFDDVYLNFAFFMETHLTAALKQLPSPENKVQ